MRSLASLSNPFENSVLYLIKHFLSFLPLNGINLVMLRDLKTMWALVLCLNSTSM